MAPRDLSFDFDKSSSENSPLSTRPILEALEPRLLLDGVDFGDAPDGLELLGYPTLLAHNGAYHVVGGPWLGGESDFPDADPDGMPDANALGDDLWDGNDDENGVRIPTLIAGLPAKIEITVSGGDGVVDAWIDWDGDGAWQASEGLGIGLLPEGVHSISVIPPQEAVSGKTFGRFRISKRGQLSWDGAAEDGEVEDHVVYIRRPLAPDPLDPLEPGTAVSLGSGPQLRQHLSIHQKGGEDWFNWTAEDTETLDLSINFIHELGDLNLEVYDAEKPNEPLAESSSQTDGEIVRIQVEAGKSYQARVYTAAAHMIHPDYDLLFNLFGDVENYAVLFSGGYNTENNHQRYYDATRRLYETLVDDLNVPDDHIYVLFADGTDPGVDQNPSSGPNINSDMSYATHVLSATEANLQTTLTTTIRDRIDANDHFLFWSFDHGGGTHMEPTYSGYNANAATIFDEEVLNGWGASQAPRDDELDTWLGQVDAGYVTAVHGQCYAGGMQDDLQPTGLNTFSMAATNHYEFSYSDHFVEEFNDALEAGHTRTWDSYVYAHDHDSAAATRGTYSGNAGTYVYGTEHPWATSTANFSIFYKPLNVKPFLWAIGSLPTLSGTNMQTIPFDRLRAIADVQDFDGDAIGFRVEDVLSGELTKNGKPVIPGVTIIRSGESLEWTPPASAPGEPASAPEELIDAFTIRAHDGRTVSNLALPVRIGDIASGVKAEDDDIAVWEDSVNTVLDVLDNDVPGESMQVVSLGSASHGTVELVEGKVLYTPSADYHGPDSFTYEAALIGESETRDTATVNLTVRSVNDAPTAGDDNLTVPANSSANHLPVVWNGMWSDEDADGDVIKPIPVPGSGPAHGTLEKAPDGSLLYTPDPGYIGPDSFQYQAYDEQAYSLPAVVNINVEGENFVEHDHYEGATGQVTLVGGPIGSAPTSFPLIGSAQQDVFFQGIEGTAFDDDGNGRDEVATEIVALNLSGSGVTLTLNPAYASTGQMEELVNSNSGWLEVAPFAIGSADSFFDVFFQIDIGGGVVLHNDTPVRIEMVIDHKPSAKFDLILLPPNGPMELFDPNGNPTGIFLVGDDIEPDPLTKWEQWPEHDENGTYIGWDELSIYGGQQIVADDWVCFTPQPVTDVHWWGSFKGWSLENVPEQELPQAFHFGIWKDIPANTDDFFSHPGELVWEYVSTDYSMTFAGMEQDPRDLSRPLESAFYFESYLPQESWFHQPGDEGIYWISISAQYADPAAVELPWGWLTVKRDPDSPAPDDAVRVFNPTDPILGSQPGPWTSGSDVFPNPDGLYGTPETFEGVSYGDTGVRINSLRMVPDNELGTADSFFDVFFDITVTDTTGGGDQFYVDSFFDVFTELTIDPAGATGTFDTEMVAMNLAGPLGDQFVIIREALVAESKGVHTISDIGGGLYHIDSFFDVFTELSVDGGETWIAADRPIQMAGSDLTDVWAQGEPIFWPDPAESWDMAFLLTTQEIERDLDFGDAPEDAAAGGYPTLLPNGARHHLGGPWLGNAADAPDAEPDGQPDPNAMGDDLWDGNDDENGVQIPMLYAGKTDTITFEVNSADGLGGYVDAWIDWNNDMMWDDATERIFGDYRPNGTYPITVTPPVDSVVGQTFARFRISEGDQTIPQGGRLSPEGPGGLGEVEDHEVAIGFVEVDVFPEKIEQIVLEIPGVDTQDPSLPATDGAYRSLSEVFGNYSGPDMQLVLTEVRLQALADPPPVIMTIGSDEMEVFDATLVGSMLVIGGPGGGGVVPVTLTGPVETIARGKASHTTGTFDTEIVSMSLSGQVGEVTLELRESLSLPSPGMTSITDLGGGLYHIDSFFDVFTELSVDGGATWIPSAGPGRVELAQQELISAAGTAVEHVYFEGDEGVAHDDDGDGLDEVNTEIVSLDLRGYSSMGPVSVGLRSDVPSLGQITELQQTVPGTLDIAPFTSGGLADSFFDVWTEITVNGQTLVVDEPIRIGTTIAHKPPQDGERYVSPYATRVELIDPLTGAGTGIYVIRQINQPDSAIEVDIFEDTTALVTLVGGPIPTPTLFALQGPAEVHVFFEGLNEGDAVDDDVNGRDEVVTQLVSMNLTNAAGNITMRVRDVSQSPFSPSLGQIEELVNNTPGRMDLDPFHPGDAESFFDVLFDIELPDGMILHNEQPLRLETIIEDKPPTFAQFIGAIPQGGLELYTENNDPSGIRLVAAEHHIGQPGVDDLDFGDAPDPRYPTLLANDGARHQLVANGPFMGASVDPEHDGQPDPNALGDDNDGNDDEQGVWFPGLIVPGDPAAPVRINMTASPVDGLLNAWIDFDGNGSWDAAEQIFADQTLVAGIVNNLTFSVPNTAQPGRTFARFRVDSGGRLGPEGLAEDGEVEDHQVFIEEADLNPKWVQMPDITPNGIDIRLSDLELVRTLADDFECTLPSSLTDVHLWGSWLYDEKGTIENIHLSIHSDDPVGPGGTNPDNPYSMPDRLLWESDFGTESFREELYRVVENPGEYWWDPIQGELMPGGDTQIWRVDIDIDPEMAFVQTGTLTDPVIYWLDVRVKTSEGDFGWKTRQWPAHYMDDAVLAVGDESPMDWVELTYPAGHPYHDTQRNSIDMAFALTFEEVSDGDIRGRKFHDYNANGVRDAGDEYLNGWTIELSDSSGVVIDTQLTRDIDLDGDTLIDPETERGLYWFDGLQPGTYTVSEIMQNGWQASTPTIHTIVIGSGEFVDGVAFGNYVPGSIHGFKFEDMDADGRYDPTVDPPLGGVDFLLIGTDGKGDPVAGTTTTDANGEFAFRDLVPGTYTVTEQVPAGWMATTAISFTTNLISRQELVAFPGQMAQGPVAIIDNGDLDYLTTGPGWALSGAAGHEGDHETSDPDAGNTATWTFPVVDGAVYSVSATWVANSTGATNATFTVTAGSASSVVSLNQLMAPNDFSDDGSDWEEIVTIGATGGAMLTVVLDDLGANGLVVADAIRIERIEAVEEKIEIVVGEELMFGNTGRGSIHGYKFEDLDGDGAWDLGEPALPDVPIRLDWTDSSGQTSSVMIPTGADGQYAFTGLEPGIIYVVTEIPPPGSVQTTPDPAPIFLQSGFEWVATAEQAAILIAQGIDPGKIIIDPDMAFGNTFPGSIHGFKFEDIDADGSYNDLVDLPLFNVKFILADATGIVVETTTTDIHGEFWFTGLMPGDYTVTEIVPTGFVATTPISFSSVLQSRQELVAFDGQAKLPDGDPRVEIVVGTELMFGNTVPGSIHGFKFEDVDFNGQYTPDVDLPLAGVDFTLVGIDGQGNLVQTIETTDANGEFGFTGLLASVNGAGPGTGYTVSEMVPAGFFATTPTVFSTDLLSRQELVALPDQAMLPDSVRTTINFDNVDASGGPISGAALQSYLNQLGVTITDITPSGLGQIVDDRFGFPSQVLRAFTDTNVFWHDSPNDPYSYTLNFATPQVSFDFIRPELFSSTPSGLIVAPWRARAFDRYGNLLDTVSEPQLAFLGTVPPVAFVLNGPEIASVIFDRTIPNTVATLNRVPTDNWTFDVPTDPRREVLVGTELMFGNAREEVSVVGRHVFYNNSALDGNDPAANPGDDGAIAPGKTVLLPTGIVGPSNYSSYSRGINGIMVDINNLTAAPTVADFGIRINSASAPNTWSVGPNPVISVRLGAGVGGSDRVTLIWSDGAIINRWLEVTVKSDLSGGGLGLPTDDVFYFGNVVGDSDGDRDVDEDDFAAVLGEFGPAVAGLTSDFNADGRVNLTDFIILRSNFDNTLAIPTFPAPAPVAAAAPVAATSTPLVSQPLDVIDENYVSDRNRDSSVIAPSLQAAPVLDLLGESLLAGEYVPQAQATVPAPAMQFAATTEYDLRPLDNDMMADGEGDDLLADILAESMLALVL